MRFVGAVLDAHRHGAAGGAPVLRIVIAALHLEFRHRFRSRHEALVGGAGTGFHTRVGHAVQQQVARSRQSAVDRHALRHVVARVEGPRRPAKLVGADVELHAEILQRAGVGRHGDLEGVPARGQLRRGAHYLALIGGRGLQQLGPGRNRDHLVHHADFHDEILLRLVAQAQLQIVPNLFREPRGRDCQPIGTHRQHRERIQPGLVRGGAGDIVGAEILRLDGHTRHNRSLGVLDKTRNSGAKFLGEERQASR